MGLLDLVFPFLNLSEELCKYFCCVSPLLFSNCLRRQIMLVLNFSETFLIWDSGTRKPPPNSWTREQLRCLRWHFLCTEELFLNVPAHVYFLLRSARIYTCYTHHKLSAARLVFRSFGEGEAIEVQNERLAAGVAWYSVQRLAQMAASRGNTTFYCRQVVLYEMHVLHIVQYVLWEKSQFSLSVVVIHFFASEFKSD